MNIELLHLCLFTALILGQERWWAPTQGECDRILLEVLAYPKIASRFQGRGVGMLLHTPVKVASRLPPCPYSWWCQGRGLLPWEAHPAGHISGFRKYGKPFLQCPSLVTRCQDSCFITFICLFLSFHSFWRQKSKKLSPLPCGQHCFCRVPSLTLEPYGLWFSRRPSKKHPPWLCLWEEGLVHGTCSGVWCLGSLGPASAFAGSA